MNSVDLLNSLYARYEIRYRLPTRPVTVYCNKCRGYVRSGDEDRYSMHWEHCADYDGLPVPPLSYYLNDDVPRTDF